VQVHEELDNDGNNDYLNCLALPPSSCYGERIPLRTIVGGYNPSFFYAVDRLTVRRTSSSNWSIRPTATVFRHSRCRLQPWRIGDNILGRLIPARTTTETRVWGQMINFDNDVAAISSSKTSLSGREYHIDGFRFDFTRPIHNQSDATSEFAAPAVAGISCAAACPEKRQSAIILDCRGASNTGG